MKVKYAEPTGYFNSDMNKAFKSASKKAKDAQKKKNTAKKSK